MLVRLQEKSQLLEAQVSDLNLQLQATKERNAVLQHQISSPSTPLPHSEAAADPHTVTELHTRCQVRSVAWHAGRPGATWLQARALG